MSGTLLAELYSAFCYLKLHHVGVQLPQKD